jgi:hypothetical protein
MLSTPGVVFGKYGPPGPTTAPVGLRATRGDRYGSKFDSTAREDKYGPGIIGIPQIRIIGAGLILPILRI